VWGGGMKGQDRVADLALAVCFRFRYSQDTKKERREKRTHPFFVIKMPFEIDEDQASE